MQHLDSLLNSLVLYTQLYHRRFSLHELTFGLPLATTAKSPVKNIQGIFKRAAKRAGLVSQLIKSDLSAISPLQLPIILLLKNNETCILDSFSTDKQQAKVVLDTESPSESWVDIETLETQYLGYAYMLKPDFHHDDTEKQARTAS